ncbi:MAG: hypothetical protein NZ937_00970 [Armatimonadetes bacterium]|nr:hypothetical protein [Armatimonadota bacterium]
MRQENWLFIGFGVLLVSLLIAWRMAVTISINPENSRQGFNNLQSNGNKELRVKGGHLVAEIPQREERWELQFTTSHYDPDKRVATTKDGTCQVIRKGKVITIFHAPIIIVRFKEREMEMKDGITIVAVLPKLKMQLKVLNWNWETGKLIGKGQIKIQSEKFNAFADYLEGNTDLMRFSLKGVKLDWRSESGE